MDASIVLHYFKDLSPVQVSQINALGELYRYWNQQINVISRKDIHSLYLRHVLHSLAIAKVVDFSIGTKILDVGTGGGFPGIPLAILFPESDFTLVDSIGKKIKVVEEVSRALNLRNVTAVHSRVEQIPGRFHFVVSRAVTRLSTFYPWIKDKIYAGGKHAVPNGLLYLKGGDLTQEIKESGLEVNLIPVYRYFREPFFDTKYIVQIPK